MKFERGYYIDSDTSNYKNYLTKKFEGTAHDIIDELDITIESILDFGCAMGGLIDALIRLGHKRVTGTDISYWAIDEGRQMYNLSSWILQHYNRQLLEDDYDYVIFLDVLEHVPLDELHAMLSRIKSNKIIVRLPVSAKEGENFVLNVSQNDKTHIQIHDKIWWNMLFERYGFILKTLFEREYIYESDGVLARMYERK